MGLLLPERRKIGMPCHRLVLDGIENVIFRAAASMSDPTVSDALRERQREINRAWRIEHCVIDAATVSSVMVGSE